MFAYSFKPLHLNINNYILLNFLFKFRMVQIGEFSCQSGASEIGDRFLYAHDLNV